MATPNTDKTPYFDPESGRDLTSEDIKKLSPDEQKEVAKAWFHQHYEDPAENTPYETAEGGYIYIWGGPHDAREVLWSEFGGLIPEGVLELAADELESERDITEWASIPGPEDFDLGYLASEFYPRFQTSVQTVRRLLTQEIDEADKPSFFALLYANAITILEAYLSDVFISLVLRHPILLRKFVESDPIFKVQRITASELFKQMDAIPARVRKHLYVLPFHRLEKVQKMYQAVLGISFPAGLGDILDAVATRHDIVHRNGLTKEGKAISLSTSDVENLLVRVERLVENVDFKIRELLDDMLPRADPELLHHPSPGS
jgi:hypothetical protein